MPPSIATIMKGTPSQTLTMMTTARALGTVSRNSTRVPPRAEMTPFTRPLSRSKMNFHENADTNAGTAHGRMSRTR